MQASSASTYVGSSIALIGCCVKKLTPFDTLFRFVKHPHTKSYIKMVLSVIALLRGWSSYGESPGRLAVLMSLALAIHMFDLHHPRVNRYQQFRVQLLMPIC